MIALLSPAKRIAQNVNFNSAIATIPEYIDKANKLMTIYSGSNVDEIAREMKISYRLAASSINQAYNFSTADNIGVPAILGYDGVAYKKLVAADFTNEDLQYAQAHVRIGSGCYGILKPLDLIKPYRLDFYNHIDGYGRNLQDYWKPYITESIIQDVKNQGGILINAASAETFEAFDIRRLIQNIEVVNIKFMQLTKTDFKCVHSVLAKQSRGSFVKYIIANRIDNIDDLKGFTGMNMRFFPETSDAHNLYFIKQE